ncbi:hypothetical protein FD754_010800 [Muntiacus muntjak]|uniref:HTH CENPB-type domain-containing protein n=1 Tax=Muntiacus muntjak TaxID=9888 RepID=A0A5N3WZ06_MUNMU|nr:hypothetical protein FD754_010800 [Muntiacus muntjak]
MVSLDEDGMSNGKIVSQVVNAKEKFLREMKSATPINTKMILNVDVEQVLVVWVEDQNRHYIPVSQNLIQGEVLSLHSRKPDRGEEAAEGKFEGGRSWLFRRSYIFHVNKTAFSWRKVPSSAFVAREEELMPDFKVFKDRLTLLLGATAVDDFHLKIIFVLYSPNSRVLKNYAKATLPVFHKWWGDLLLRKKKKKSFQSSPAHGQWSPGHPRALMEMYSEIFAVFMRANTTTILRSMNQGVILNFKSYYLRNMFYKGIAAINSDSSYGSKQIKQITFWKEFTILYAMKNICDSWEEVKISILTGVWKKSVPTLSDDIEGFKISVEEITSNPEATNELLRSSDETLMNERLYYTNLVDKMAAGFERIDSKCGSSTVGERLSHSIACYRGTVKGRLNYCKHSSLQQPPPDQLAAISIKASPSTREDYRSLKAQMMLSNF